MNNRELVNALEDIIDTERELREQIEKLNVALRCNAIISSMGSDELKRQEQIVDNIEIGEFDQELNIPTLSQKELEERKKMRESLDFSIGISIESPKLTKDELEKRAKERENNNFTLHYGGNQQVPKLLDSIYKDATIFLQRKYNLIPFPTIVVT